MNSHLDPAVEINGSAVEINGCAVEITGWTDGIQTMQSAASWRPLPFYATPRGVDRSEGEPRLHGQAGHGTDKNTHGTDKIPHGTDEWYFMPKRSKMLR